MPSYTPKKDAAEPQSVQDLAVSLLTTLRGHVGQLGAALAPALHRQDAEAHAVLEQVKSRTFRALAKSDADAGKALAALTERTKAGIERTKALRKLQELGLEEVRSDLDAMLRRLGGGTAGNDGSEGSMDRPHDKTARPE